MVLQIGLMVIVKPNMPDTGVINEELLTMVVICPSSIRIVSQTIQDESTVARSGRNFS